MTIQPLFFYLFAGIALAFALLTVIQKSPVASAFSLVVVFFCFAALYALMDAHLVAALQILVYAGAIMVLFVFVIMLLNADSPVFDVARSHKGVRAMVAVTGALLFGAFVFVFKNSVLPAATGAFTVAKIEAAGGNTRVLSEVLFSDYILPFELTSVLLLAGIVGSIAIAKRKRAHS